MQFRQMLNEFRTKSSTMRFRALLCAIAGIASFATVPSHALGQGFGYNNGPAPGQPYPSQPTFTPPPNTPPQYNAPQYNAPQYNAPQYNAPQYNAPPSSFGTPTTVLGTPGYVPSASDQSFPVPGQSGQTLPPLNQPWEIDPSNSFLDSSPLGYNPRVRDVPIDVFVQEGQTGRFSVGGSVNSDLGVAGQVILEERNFDIRRWPNRPRDLLNGAFRGAGQNFRLELVPGTQVQRYTLNWTEPNLFGYSPFNLSIGGFYFTRLYRDWTEQRLGARAAIGYDVTPDLSLSTEIRGENVNISHPRVTGVSILDRALGNNDLYTGRVRLAHNTRDSPFLPTEGHLLEMIYDQNFGKFDFPRGQINFSRYFLIRERADSSGRHTLTTSWRVGLSGADTPIFENYFAGGFSTMRGFQFRGASPVENNVQVGGRFQFLGSVEYMLPITADDMLRMVAFVDYGTVERDIKLDWNNFRVSPGLGARIAVPALGPAPLAFDFSVPVASASTDTKQVFSFSMGLTR